MARPSTSPTACPSCRAPLVEIRLGDGLVLRSCSRCDGRFWSRLDRPADLDHVLSVVAAGGRTRHPVAARG